MHSLFNVILVSSLAAMASGCLEPCQYDVSTVNIQKVTESLKIANDFTRAALKTRNCCEAFQARLREVMLDLNLAKGHINEIITKNYVGLGDMAASGEGRQPSAAVLSRKITPDCDRDAIKKAVRKTILRGVELTSVWKKVKDGLEGEQCDQLNKDVYNILMTLLNEINEAQSVISSCQGECRVEAGKTEEDINAVLAREFWNSKK